ncbi:hypothetical protein E2562_029473 [Oryza meyeriana var. granulata]|uniref:Uncharacterized protein n=1 Tax=Oryza meyeriana var. granulata TaxID=110450 RepID=A0A6G1DPU6_9ORYZ|nr:hypothetical protein E2562_029473 [Oryza meyeriana var. granulata]
MRLVRLSNWARHLLIYTAAASSMWPHTYSLFAVSAPPAAASSRLPATKLHLCRYLNVQSSGVIQYAVGKEKQTMEISLSVI